jgi:ABC-type transport system involved in cytochrome c biogenesis permease subunit
MHLVNILSIALQSILYFLSSLFFVIFFFVKKRKFVNFANIFIVIGLILQAIFLISSYIREGYFPISTLKEAFFFFSWVMLLGFLILSKIYNLYILGTFLVPFSFILFILGSTLPMGLNFPENFASQPLFPIHTLFSIIGDASLGVAAFIGLVFSLEKYFLKNKLNIQLFKFFPSMEILDELIFKIITFGFIFLTIGLLTGFIWLKLIRGVWWIADPKIVFSIITWFYYIVIIHLRLVFNLKGAKIAKVAMFGFLGVLFTFVSVNLLFRDSWHVF